MKSIHDCRDGISVFIVKGAALYTGIVDSSRDTREKGWLVTIHDKTNEKGIIEKGSTVCFLNEIFLTQEEALERAVKECDGIIEALESRKTKVIQDLRKGRNRQKKIGKELLEIRRELKNELTNLNI